MGKYVAESIKNLPTLKSVAMSLYDINASNISVNKYCSAYIIHLTQQETVKTKKKASK